MTDAQPATDIAPPPTPASRRLASIDAYRGFVMLLLMAEAMHFAKVAEAHPESKVWAFLARHQSHVEWVGCTLHDLIQPSFSFLVGAAMAFSLRARAARGQTTLATTAHAFWRAFVLVALGIFLRSMGKTQTNFTFEDTLTQIGLGYGFLYLIAVGRGWIHWAALVVLLVGYWGAFVAYPLPPAGFDYAAVHADAAHLRTGLEAHWNKNSNLAWRFDTWFLNLFPREEKFLFNSGGYATLSFIPTLATMLMGLIAGDLLVRDDRGPWAKVGLLLAGGLASLGAGWALGEYGYGPVVKRIWTPSWTLYSGGWCLLILGVSYALIDVVRFRGWAYPLAVIGANSIAAYLMTWVFEGFLAANLKTHFGDRPFEAFGAEYATVVRGAVIVAIMWLVLAWMYNKRIFVRV